MSRVFATTNGATTPLAPPSSTESARTNQAILEWLVATLFAGAWLLLTAATSRVAPRDNIEQLTWVRSLEWGYYKHPPLPTWLLWPLVQVFGLEAWTSYVMGALMTLAAVTLVRSIVAQMCGRQEANLCALAMLCVTYYNGRLYYYNHNTVLLLVTAACAWTSWRALRTRQLAWWGATGALLGLGGLAKYQMVVTAACVVTCWALERGWRDRVHMQGAALAALIASTILAPHLLWLVRHDFPSFHYAMSSSLGAALGCNERAVQSITWLGDQLLNRALPAWLMLAMTAFFGLRARRRSIGLAIWSGVPSRERQTLSETARSFLLVWGLLPLSFITGVSLATGADLQLQWGTAFVLFVVPVVSVLTRDRMQWGRTSAAVMLGCFTCVQLALMVLNLATSPGGPAAKMHHWQAFDIEALMQAIEQPIRQQSGKRSICLISGPPAIAGALSLRLPEHPAVLVDGRWDRSPWAADAKAQPACIVLEVVQANLPGYRVAEGAFGQFGWRLRPVGELSDQSGDGRVLTPAGN